MVRPRFATPSLRSGWLAQIYTASLVRAEPRAMMKFAPAAPIKSCGFLSLITSRVFPQAGVPFRSSVSGVAKAEVLMGLLERFRPARPQVLR
jgi:hypothetical protein